MSAACSTSYSPQAVAGQRQRTARAAWQAPPRPLLELPTYEGSSAQTPRRLTIRTPAAVAVASTAAPASPPHHHHTSPASDLAVYHFSQRRAGTAAEWFQAAVRDIVRQVDSQAPFLQTVQLGRDGTPPRLHTYGVQESVVAAPELWQGIAEHVSHSSPDVVILVQRVSPHAADSPQGAMDAAEADQQQRGAADAAAAAAASGSYTVSGSSSPSPPGSPRSPRVQAEEACRRLVCSGLADAILQGQVGDCCDGSGHGHSHDCADGGSAVAEPRQQQTAAQQRPLPLPAIVPFSPGSGSPAGLARRVAVRTAALRPPGAPGSGSCTRSACYYGLVVQSRRHTGTEGCYLLKTVKNVSPGTGCTCTHFSLTRISAGEHLEKQLVQSWLL